MESKQKQAILSSLCKHLSLDPKSLSDQSVEGSDVKSLFVNILNSSGKDGLLENNEVLNWITFADSFVKNSDGCNELLKKLNEDLIVKSVLLGDGFNPSAADVVVFSAVHLFVIGLTATEREKYVNVLRWMDYIQNKEDLLEIFEIVPVEKTCFDPPVLKDGFKVEASSSSKKSVQGPKTDEKSKVDSNSKKTDELEAISNAEMNDKLETDTSSKKSAPKKKGGSDGKVTEEKKKAPEKESTAKDVEVSVSLLNIQVGLIRKAWKHPSADSLLVEEIDLGDGGIRQVVSGLAKHCSPDALLNRRVALITNVKPGKLRDVASSGLVLCASNSEQTVVEPLLPPEGAKIGERVTFSGHDEKPEDVLNPKKKQLEKITPHLHTDDQGVATFKGIPFMTSAGPCTSSIPNASIK
ncbi:hypothetical protein IFM89_033517 [Coptis chinensis]|uniref:tRNA-binding domain-containing protein n=1 Tax=Coptis chinensis TaxID=261450 RepID=A0A835LJA7_9MAGN|nr:hypothetical protein IFM89_033517 [Coptis chinensis]